MGGPNRPEYPRGTHHLEFVLRPRKGKTVILNVVNVHSMVAVGEIKWWGAWRKYCFFPQAGTVFDTNCMNDINEQIERLMKERREARR